MLSSFKTQSVQLIQGTDGINQPPRISTKAIRNVDVEFMPANQLPMMANQPGTPSFPGFSFPRAATYSSYDPWFTSLPEGDEKVGD